MTETSKMVKETQSQNKDEMDNKTSSPTAVDETKGKKLPRSSSRNSDPQKQNESKEDETKKVVNDDPSKEDNANDDDDDDDSEDNAPQDQGKRTKPEPSSGGGKDPPFPVKLHRILSNDDYADMIAWLPHGRSWRVIKPKAFEEKVLPQHFRHGKYASFMRQVNGWGFKRVTQGPDHNSYFHEFFVRGIPDLSLKMRRPSKLKNNRLSTEFVYPPLDIHRLNALQQQSAGAGATDESGAPGSVSTSMNQAALSATAAENYMMDPSSMLMLQQNSMNLFGGGAGGNPAAAGAGAMRFQNPQAGRGLDALQYPSMGGLPNMFNPDMQNMNMNAFLLQQQQQQQPQVVQDHMGRRFLQYGIPDGPTPQLPFNQQMLPFFMGQGGGGDLSGALGGADAAQFRGGGGGMGAAGLQNLPPQLSLARLQQQQQQAGRMMDANMLGLGMGVGAAPGNLYGGMGMMGAGMQPSSSNSMTSPTGSALGLGSGMMNAAGGLGRINHQYLVQQNLGLASGMFGNGVRGAPQTPQQGDGAVGSVPNVVSTKDSTGPEKGKK